MQIMTIQSFGDSLRIKSQANEDTWKDGSFVLLQLVHALKILQAQGIEELPLSLTSFVLCREVDKDVNFRLCVLQRYVIIFLFVVFIKPDDWNVQF